VCRTIKQEFKMEDVFVVILTAKGQAYDQHTAKSYGANYSMTKPFDPDGLLALVTEVLNKDGIDHA
jgi:DNA-binding response OmpR family regulator